jgi:hypothetical protein
MTRDGKRPEKFTGDRDVVSAWVVFAVLLIGLVLVPAFHATVSEGVTMIAQLR